MIDWLSFVLVAGASLLGASVFVTFASLGLRLRDSAEALVHASAGRRTGASRVRSFGSLVCFAACLGAVAYGVYLIVPAFG